MIEEDDVPELLRITPKLVVPQAVVYKVKEDDRLKKGRTTLIMSPASRSTFKVKSNFKDVDKDVTPLASDTELYMKAGDTIAVDETMPTTAISGADAN